MREIKIKHLPNKVVFDYDEVLDFDGFYCVEIIDGVEYDVKDPVFVYGSLSAGKHVCKVYADRKSGVYAEFEFSVLEGPRVVLAKSYWRSANAVGVSDGVFRSVGTGKLFERDFVKFRYFFQTVGVDDVAIVSVFRNDVCEQALECQRNKWENVEYSVRHDGRYVVHAMVKNEKSGVVSRLYVSDVFIGDCVFSECDGGFERLQ